MLRCWGNVETVHRVFGFFFVLFLRRIILIYSFIDFRWTGKIRAGEIDVWFRWSNESRPEAGSVSYANFMRLQLKFYSILSFTAPFPIPQRRRSAEGSRFIRWIEGHLGSGSGETIARKRCGTILWKLFGNTKPDLHRFRTGDILSAAIESNGHRQRTTQCSQ